MRRPVALVFLLLVACTPAAEAPGGGSSGGGSSGGEHRGGDAVARTSWSGPRPAYHLTPERHWMNDPQRPFFLDGRWHLYYLYNADHPHGNGTSWFHATSTDLVHWRDEGVAIEKYRDGLGDIQTGSTVVDADNTAGFGAGAVIALVTQQDAGVQRQSLFYSTDGGSTFTPYEGNPVMDNPGAEHWRDPKVVWDDRSEQWLMVLAEGHKLGFYTSPDLKTWTYRSGFERDDLGLLECPDLFRMSVDGDPERTTWVLAASANGEAYGRTTGLAYWTGDWDGTTFTADRPDPLWLDSGPDFYAATTWSDPRIAPERQLAGRYAIGWMNNWAYAGALPTDGWAGGMLSTVRELTLTTDGDRPTLRSRPVEELTGLETEATDAGSTEIGTVTLGAGEQITLEPGTAAYRLRVAVTAGGPDAAQEVRIRLPGGVSVGLDVEAGIVFLVRDRDPGGRLPEAYRQVGTAPVTAPDGRVEFDVLVDAGSVEAFVNDGEAAVSALAREDSASPGAVIESVGGTAQVVGATVIPLRAAQPDRR